MYDEIVTDHNGYERFKECDISEISHIDSTGQKIRCTAIDQFVKEKKIRSIKILKIDVEGAEMKVLAGSLNSMNKGIIKNVLMEINSNNINYHSSHIEIIKLLQKYGYAVKIFSGNKLISVKDCTPTQNNTYNIFAHLK